MSFDNNQTRKPVGYSGTSLTIAFSEIPKNRDLIFFFSHPGYLPEAIHIDSDDFMKTDSFPDGSPLKLKSAIVNVTFLTCPPDAVIYQTLFSYPQSPQYIGLSGHTIKWDISRFQAGQKVELTFKLNGYKDRHETIGSNLFSRPDNIYPAGKDPIRLDPKIPIVTPLYYWIKYNKAVFIIILIIFLTLTGILLFRVILPGRRKLRQQIDRAAHWEKIAQQAVNRDDPLFGKRLGDYRIANKLGAGGMATVYRAVPEFTLREEDSVAIKVMQEDMSKDEDFCRRFKREVRISSELSHPSIVQVIDYGEHDGQLYLVMEMIKGKPLRDIITKDGFALREFMEIFRPILQALQYAHDKGIIHRDLKPENIMFTDDSKIKVMDFGLARGHQYSAITKTGTALGTPAYMAPEQITSNTIDKRSDQYTLGVIAYEMLTGRLPFIEDNPINIMFKHVTDPPIPLREFKPNLPKGIEDIILKILERSRRKDILISTMF